MRRHTILPIALLLLALPGCIGDDPTPFDTDTDGFSTDDSYGESTTEDSVSGTSTTTMPGTTTTTTTATDTTGTTSEGSGSTTMMDSTGTTGERFLCGDTFTCGDAFAISQICLAAYIDGGPYQDMADCLHYLLFDLGDGTCEGQQFFQTWINDYTNLCWVLPTDAERRSCFAKDVLVETSAWAAACLACDDCDDDPADPADPTQPLEVDMALKMRG